MLLQRWCFLVLSVSKLLIAFSKAYFRLRFSVIQNLNLPESVYLTEKEKLRLRHYFLGTTYLKVVFHILHSKGDPRHEKGLFSNLSALASLFDDMVDRQRKPIAIERPGDPVTFSLTADKGVLARHLLENVYQRLPPQNITAFKGYMQQVFLAEMEGKDFAGIGCDLSQMERLTKEKGGASVLLFRSLLQHLPTPQEEKALREFGCLIQLADDIFDVWFDKQNGVTTLATMLIVDGRTGDLERSFERQWERTRKSFFDMPLPMWRIGMALEVLHILTGITRTCIFRYRQIEKTHSRLPILDRKLMVTDMGKWRNQLLAVRFLLFSP